LEEVGYKAMPKMLKILCKSFGAFTRDQCVIHLVRTSVVQFVFLKKTFAFDSLKTIGGSSGMG
jgi:hypothetical protein